MIQLRRDKGFALLATGVSIFAVIGMMGLAVDMGRLYIHKNEAQTFTDMAALAAAWELDGTDAGLAAAQARVTGSAMKWAFGTSGFGNTTTEFSMDGATGWTPAPPSPPAGYSYVRVTTTTSNVNLYFLPVATDTWSSHVAARSVAGKILNLQYRAGGVGTLPFAPIIINNIAPDYGFQRPCWTCGPGGSRLNGSELTLRWPAKAKAGSNRLCDADDSESQVTRAEIGGSDERGYIQETSSDDIREAIEDDDIDYTVELGQSVFMTGGIKATQAKSLMDRAEQDLPGGEAVDYFLDYEALADSEKNGRRIGIVPLVDPLDSFRVLAFARVFLPMSQDVGGNLSLCAEYIGPATFDTSGGGNVSQTGFTVRLIE